MCVLGLRAVRHLRASSRAHAASHIGPAPIALAEQRGKCRVRAAGEDLEEYRPVQKKNPLLEFPAFLLPTNLGQPIHSQSTLTELPSPNFWLFFLLPDPVQSLPPTSESTRALPGLCHVGGSQASWKSATPKKSSKGA